MSKKKKGSAQRKSGGQSKNTPASKKSTASQGGGRKWLWLTIGSIAVVAVVALIASGGGSKAPASGSAPAAGTAGNAPFLDPKTAVATADEQKYMGRFLPEGYAEPSVTDAVTYDQVVQMTDVAPTQDAKGISVAVDDVVSNKIVYFEYQRSGDKPLPLMAYVKPSGKLFVGVSYCPPCEGQYQRIEPDGTLTCESCGTKRALESSVGLGGACKLYPTDELPVTVSGDRVTITADVLNGWTAQPLDRKIG